MSVKLEDTGERLIPDLHPGELAEGAHIARYQSVVELAENRRVLDIASGTGYGTKLLASSAAHVHGVDYSNEAVAYAEAHYGASNITYINADAHKLPLEDDSIDLVVCFETIEHLTDPAAFIKEVKRVMTPAGIAIISTPNQPESPRGNHYHLHEFTLSELDRLMKKNFAYSEMHLQGVWFGTAIVTAKQFETQWVDTLEVRKSVTQPAHEAAYLFAVGSDDSAPLPSFSVTLASSWSARRQQFHEETQQVLVDGLRREAEAARRDLGVDKQAMHERYEELLREHQHVITSKGWRAYSWAKKTTSRLRRS